MKNNLVHLFGINYQSVKYFVLNGSRAELRETNFLECKKKNLLFLRNYLILLLMYLLFIIVNIKFLNMIIFFNIYIYIMTIKTTSISKYYVYILCAIKR